MPRMEKNKTTLKRSVKCGLLIVLIGILGYKSVYIRKLGDVKKEAAGKFDPVSFSRKLWEEKLPGKLDSAIQLCTLDSLLAANPPKAFADYSNATALGNYRYFLVNTSGIVTAIGEDDLSIAIPCHDTTLNITLATEFIYGNAIRDASKLVDIRDFTGISDLNNISAALNDIVRKEVLPSFKAAIKKGSRIQLAGAIQINREHIKVAAAELIPVRIKILP